MKTSTTRRATLAVAAAAGLVACLALYACSTTGHASGVTTVDPPFMDPITITFTLNNDGTTGCQINGGPTHANKCVQVTWSDAQGNTVGTTTIETDGNGSASGQVPPGSVRWEVNVVDCPEPDEDERDDGTDGEQGRVFLPGALAQDPVGAMKRKGASPALRMHLIQGGPIVPSASGDVNLIYAFVVEAGGFAEAKALVEPILQGGIGTPVPPTVMVVAYARMIAEASGGRYLQAQPGKFQAWGLDFNGGAFQADQTTAVNYALNGWDVLEASIPLSAFDFGTAAGVEYSNVGVVNFSTDLLPEPVMGSYSFSFSN